MESIRVLTLNIWGEQPPLERRMSMLGRGLREMRPDVVALQEVRQVEGQLPNQARTLAEQCGYEYAFAPATKWGGGEEGVAILSLHPIEAQESLVLPASTPEETRVALMARVKTPVGSICCYSTHLNYRLTHGIHREQQVVGLDDFVKKHAGPMPQILMGDFNATPAHDEIRFLRGEHTLEGRRAFYQDAYQRRFGDQPGYTWARKNAFTERMRWLERDRRLDYVFVTPMTREGRGVVHDCRIVFDIPDADGCFASDHFGVVAEIQIAALTPVS